jgi:hypothetical protein
VILADVQARLATLYPAYDTLAVNPDGVPFPTPYYVLYGALDELGDKRLTSTQDADSDASYALTVRAVSTSAVGARRMSELARGVLIGWAPNVAGRSCSVRFDGEDDPQTDKDFSTVVFQDVDYVLVSRRA